MKFGLKERRMIIQPFLRPLRWENRDEKGCRTESVLSEVAGDFVCVPDGGHNAAHAVSIADGVDFNAHAAKLAFHGRTRAETYRHNDGVCGNFLAVGAVFHVLNNSAVIIDSRYLIACAYLDTVVLENVACHHILHHGHRQTGGEDIVQSFNDRDLFAFHGVLDRHLNAGETTTDYRNGVADLLAADENVHAGGVLLIVMAGDRRINDGRARCLKHNIRGYLPNHIRGDLGIEADFNTVLLQLTLEPLIEHTHVLLERMAACRDKVAAESTAGFAEDNFVPAALCGERCLHTGDAAADNENLLGLSGLLDAVSELAGNGRIDGTAMEAADAHFRSDALAAGKAGTNAIDFAAGDLVGVSGIGKRRTAKGDSVKLTGSDCGFADVGVIHAVGHDDGNADDLLCGCCEMYVAALRSGHGRGLVIPGFVHTGVAVKCVVAVLLKELAYLKSFFECSAGFLFAGEGGMTLAETGDVALQAEAHHNRVLVAADFLYTLNDLAGYAETIFKTAAVFVRAVVGEAQRELIQQIAIVHGVYLNSVKAGFLAAACGLNFLLDLAVYSSLPEQQTKRIGSVRLTQKELKYSPEAVRMIQMLEVLKNYFEIQDLNQNQFIKLCEEFAPHYSDEVFEYVNSRIHYPKRTIAFLHSIVHRIQIPVWVEQHLFYNRRICLLNADC